MKISSLFDAKARRTPLLSFEFFPPRSPEAAERLFTSVRELSRFQPDFVSVTYGAGGSTRATTAGIAERLQKEYGLSAMAHLTCVGASRAELGAIARDLRARGIENIMALRGDPPRGELAFLAPEAGLSHASELIELLRAEGDSCIGAACYPEKHPESKSIHDDLTHLANKVRSGADFLVTQFVFDAADYVAFVARARRFGICVPILPGVIPLADFDTVLKLAHRCGATVPSHLRAALGSQPQSPQRATRGLELTRDLCDALLRAGAPGIHIYTRNQSDVSPVLDALHLTVAREFDLSPVEPGTRNAAANPSMYT